MSAPTFCQLVEYVGTLPVRSAWNRAVKAYALELLDSVEVEEIENAPQYGNDRTGRTSGLRPVLINGARTWLEYSEGGCSLVYDDEIAERCCSPSQYQRSNEGRKVMLRGRSWLEVQAWALNQAARHLCYRHSQIMRAKELEARDA